MSEETQAVIAKAVEPHFLSAEEILAADDVTYVDVALPAWGGSVRLRALSAADAIKLNELNSDPTTAKDADLYMLIMCLVDGASRPLFTLSALDKLKTKSLLVYQELQEAALKLNRLGRFAKNG